jgi:hypothetical protein
MRNRRPKWRDEEPPEVYESPSEDYFESTALKNAVWQYLIDHSQQIDGKIAKVRFCITNEQEFWRRVRARKDGKFLREEMRDFQRKMEDRRRLFEYLSQYERENQKHAQICAENSRRALAMSVSGKLYQRVCMKIAWVLRGWSKKLTKFAFKTNERTPEGKNR